MLNGETVLTRSDTAAVIPYRRLLVVDDEDSILFSMKEYLTARGFQVDCAQEMEEAEALLANIHYSAVLMDLRLTGTNGTEGLEIVRYIHERCPWTRIVLLTAYGSSEIEMEARRRGADAFLHKPMPLYRVEQVLNEVLRSRA
jgi:DNA-binding response OmpR family regulator